MGFPSGASGKEPACQCRRLKRHELNAWVRKIPWRRAWQPTQYSAWRNPMDRGAWGLTFYRVAKSWTLLKHLGTHSHANVEIFTPLHKVEIMPKESVSQSVMPDSLRPHGLQPTRLLCPWDFPGKDTGVPFPSPMPETSIKNYQVSSVHICLKIVHFSTNHINH